MLIYIHSRIIPRSYKVSQRQVLLHQENKIIQKFE